MKLTRGEGVYGGIRRIGSWRMWAVVIMLTAVASAQGVSTTTVQGTVYLANGQAGGGTLVLSWPAFTTAAGQAVAADQLTVTIPADGFVSVNLAPNQGATPAGEYYTAVYYMSDGSSSTQYWVVPAAATATLAQVQTQVMPAAQALQAVSKAYVDQSISELQQSLLTASGGDLTGPLYLNGDPTQPLQAADKHYVDTQVATAVPLSGGTMAGPIAFSSSAVSNVSFANLSAGLGCTSAAPLWSFYAGACVANGSGGTMVYPAAGYAYSNGNAWVAAPSNVYDTYGSAAAGEAAAEAAAQSYANTAQSNAESVAQGYAGTAQANAEAASLPLSGGTLSGALAFSNSTVSKASWTNISAGLGCTSAAPLWSFYTGTCVANGSGGGGGYTGVTSNGAGGLTATGAYQGTSLEGSAPPILDIRNPAFAGGAVCDGTTDIGPALQAALNALPSPYIGGEIQIVGSPKACYWATPSTITWPGTGTITIHIQGTLALGSGMRIASGNAVLNFVGKNGGQAGSMENSGQTAEISMPSLTGTLGTAVSTPVGTADSVTFTPSTMTGLYPGEAITVAGNLSCTGGSLSATSGVVTATFSGACHIAPNVPLTVTGCANSSFDGTFSNSSPTLFITTATDQVLNTLTYDQTSASGTTTGCTISGENEDTVENVVITATTSTTATATFYRSHAATDIWGVDEIYVNTTNGGNFKDLNISSNSGTNLFLNSYNDKLENVGLFSNACAGDLASFAIDTGQTSFLHVNGGVFNVNCQPWSFRMSQNAVDAGSQGGEIWINGATFEHGGIKMDHGGNAVFVDNSFFEEITRAAISWDPTYAWNGSQQQIVLRNSLNQDASNKVCEVAFLTPASTPITLEMSSYFFSCATNDYVEGNVKSDGGSLGSNTSRGVVGTFNDGKTIKGEIAGEGANFSPSIIPYATQSITTTPSSWSSLGSCAVSTVLGPDGELSAGALTKSTSTNFGVGSWTGTPAVGDMVLYGAWVYTPTVGQSATLGQIDAPFMVSTNGSSHFTLSSDGFIANPYGEGVPTYWDSNLANDSWHPVVGWAEVVSSDGTGSQHLTLNIGCDPTKTMEYFDPWMMYIPASANIPLAEVMRWRQQLMHAYVPSGAAAGTLAVDPNLSFPTSSLSDWTDSGISNGYVPAWNASTGKWTPTAQSSGGSPQSVTITAGAAAGTGATVSCDPAWTCDSRSGVIQLTSGTGCSAGTGLVKISWSSPLSKKAIITITPMAPFNFNTIDVDYSDASTTEVSLASASGFACSSSYWFTYHIDPSM